MTGPKWKAKHNGRLYYILIQPLVYEMARGVYQLVAGVRSSAPFRMTR